MSKFEKTDWHALESKLIELGVVVEKPHSRQDRLLCQLPEGVALAAFRKILELHATHAIFEPFEGHIVYPNSSVGSAREDRPKIQGEVSFPQRRRRRDL